MDEDPTKVVIAVGALLAAVALSTLINTPFGRWLRRRVIDVSVELSDFSVNVASDKRTEERKTEWLAQIIGSFEVATYTIVIAVGGPAGVAFFPAWVALKMAAGWGTREPSNFTRRMSMRALVLNLVNLILALVAAGFIRWRWGLSLTG